MEAHELVHALYQLKPEWDWWLRLHEVFDQDAWRLDWKDGEGQRHSLTMYNLDYRDIDPEAIVRLVS